MPESFEKPHIQEEKKEKTPEQIKEEKALSLAQRIEEIKEEMKVKGETVEDYEEIIKLAKEIEKIYSPEKQESFAPNEVLNHILHLREITSKDIVDAEDVHKRPDGTLAGRVEVKGKWLPFKGDTLITKIEGKDITSAADIHSQPDGTLAGQVEVEGELHNFLYGKSKEVLF